MKYEVLDKEVDGKRLKIPLYPYNDRVEKALQEGAKAALQELREIIKESMYERKG